MKKQLIKKFTENEKRIVSYYVGGNLESDKSLVFFNGLYVGNESWIKQQRYQYFAKNFKHIFWDYPGVGSSIEKEADKLDFDDIVNEIRNIMLAENCKKSHIIGYSVGGMIGIWFAHCFPQFVESMVLLNSGASVSVHVRSLLHTLILMLDEEVELEKLFMFLYPWNHSEEYLEKASELQMSILRGYAKYNENRASFKALLEAVWKKPDLKPVLKDISVPVLIAGSDKDMVFPSSCQEELAMNINNSKHTVIKDCGHASFIEKYQEINLLIEEHLRELYK